MGSGAMRRAGKRRYSYAELAERSWRLANALRSAGLGKGDRVATLLFNSPAMLEAHFGVPAAGGVLVAVNHRLTSVEAGYILRHSGARYLLLDAGLEALAEPAGPSGVAVTRSEDTRVSGGPGLIWELIDGEGVTHYNGAPTVQLMIINHPRAHRLERPVTAMVAAAPPVADAAGPDERAELPRRARVWPDRDLRPDHRVPGAGGVA